MAHAVMQREGKRRSSSMGGNAAPRGGYRSWDAAQMAFASKAGPPPACAAPLSPCAAPAHRAWPGASQTAAPAARAPPAAPPPAGWQSAGAPEDVAISGDQAAVPCRAMQRPVHDPASPVPTRQAAAAVQAAPTAAAPAGRRAACRMQRRRHWHPSPAHEQAELAQAWGREQNSFGSCPRRPAWAPDLTSNCRANASNCESSACPTEAAKAIAHGR